MGRSNQGPEELPGLGTQGHREPQLLNLHPFFSLSLSLRIDWWGVLVKAQRIRVKGQTGLASFKVVRCASFKNEAVLGGFSRPHSAPFYKTHTHTHSWSRLMDSVPRFSHKVVQEEKLAFVDPSRSRELKSGVKKLFICAPGNKRLCDSSMPSAAGASPSLASVLEPRRQLNREGAFLFVWVFLRDPDVAPGRQRSTGYMSRGVVEKPSIGETAS